MVVDDRLGLTIEERMLRERLPADTPVTTIYNKIDLTGQTPVIRDGEWGSEILLSAKTEAGLDLLRNISRLAWGLSRWRGPEPSWPAAVIWRLAGGDSIGTGDGSTEVHRAGELVAEELREVPARTRRSPEFTSEDSLSRIFWQFCIGK